MTVTNSAIVLTQDCDRLAALAAAAAVFTHFISSTAAETPPISCVSEHMTDLSTRAQPAEVRESRRRSDWERLEWRKC